MIEENYTYLQYDSPLGFCIHVPPCLHGDGAHDINPEKKNLYYFLVHNLFFVFLRAVSSIYIYILHYIYILYDKDSFQRDLQGVHCAQ